MLKFAKQGYKYGEIRCKGIVIRVAIADTDESRQKGLAGVATMPDNYGMLFDFGEERSVAFWMKGCLQDLSIAFITKHGTIVDIQKMSTKNPTRLHSPLIPVRYALEVTPEFFTRHNIVPGDKISF